MVKLEKKIKKCMLLYNRLNSGLAPPVKERVVIDKNLGKNIILFVFH
jgi:hypothetical protein